MSHSLYNRYESYRHEKLTKRRFNHDDLIPLIRALKAKQGYRLATAGLSVEQREIFHIRWGSGPTNVLLWSQMHGNESTATMALFDLFEFLGSDDDFNKIRDLLYKRLTLHFLPMLNPDGAQRFGRRNAMNIDINRDALSLMSPEARILESIHAQLKPDFGFNLHDQKIHTSVGLNPQPATLSFLAPPADYEKTVTPAREQAMRIISRLNRTLGNWIPGKTGRYPDAFEPRAFGDYFQQSGTGTILIESGGYPNDPEKQYVRKLNFIAITVALVAIADGSYQQESTDDYFRIPQNEERLFDLLIRRVRCRYGESSPLLDIGINRREIMSERYPAFYYRSTVADMGDLSSFNGYEEIAGNDFELVTGKLYKSTIPDTKTLQEQVPILLKKGFTGVRLNRIPKSSFTSLPVNLYNGNRELAEYPDIDGPADFILKQKGEPVTAIVNGFIYDLITGENRVKNGLVY